MSISPVASITEFDVFTGASSGTNGLPGQVPKPEAGQEGYFLRGDGTWAAVSATGGGSGGVNSVQGTVDFGFATGQEGDIATVTVTATWVTTGSVIVCSPAGVTTADHDPDDYYAESIQAYPSDIVAGTGFNINARAPFGTWGRYVINAVG